MGWFGVVHHVQGEHYQRNVLRVIASGPVGNPKSFPVHRRGPKSKFPIHGLVPVECKSDHILNYIRLCPSVSE